MLVDVLGRVLTACSPIVLHWVLSLNGFFKSVVLLFHYTCIHLLVMSPCRFFGDCYSGLASYCPCSYCKRTFSELQCIGSVIEFKCRSPRGKSTDLPDTLFKNGEISVSQQSRPEEHRISSFCSFCVVRFCFLVSDFVVENRIDDQRKNEVGVAAWQTLWVQEWRRLRRGDMMPTVAASMDHQGDNADWLVIPTSAWLLVPEEEDQKPLGAENTSKHHLPLVAAALTESTAGDGSGEEVRKFLPN